MKNLILALLLAWAGPGFAGTASAEIASSADVDVELSGTVVLQSEVGFEEPDGSISIEMLDGLLEPGVSVDAFHEEPSGRVLFSLDRTQDIPGFGPAEPNDVLSLDENGLGRMFDGTFGGLPPGSNIDAVGRDDQSRLLLSFDTTVVLDGLVVQDEDVVRTEGRSYALVLDGSAAGLPGGADVDAVHFLAPDRLLVSLDIGGVVGGYAFADEDLLEISGSLEVTPYLDGSAAHAGWGRADLEAVFVPEPAFASALLLGAGLLAALRRAHVA